MRLGVFADIHGNLEALQTVLAHAEKQHIHRYMCLGDIVGYGPNPNECIELVRALPRCNCILGNHDAAAFWRFSPYAMNEDAKTAILWTIDQLYEPNSNYLQSLPSMYIMGDICFAHANPYNPEAYRYVINRKYAARSFAAVRQRLTFVGHSHRPLLITRKNWLQMLFITPKANEITHLASHKKQIINCGSVGQPRDGDHRTSYCVLDTLKNHIELFRLEYDHQTTRDKIQQAGLPESLAKRLFRGK